MSEDNKPESELQTLEKRAVYLKAEIYDHWQQVNAIEVLNKSRQKELADIQSKVDRIKKGETKI